MQKVRRKIKQYVCLLLAVAMIGTAIPQNAIVAYAQEDNIVETDNGNFSEVAVSEEDTLMEVSELTEDQSFTEEVSDNDLTEESSEEEIVKSETESSEETETQDDISETEIGVSGNGTEEDGVSDNAMENEESVSENGTESSVSGNGTEEEASVSGNETEKKDSVSDNDMEAEDSISENETESSVSGNETEEDASVSENKTQESLSDNELTEDASSVSENEMKDFLLKAEEKEDRKIQILVNSEAAEVSARIGAQAVGYQEIDDGFEYTVAYEETLTVTVKPKDNFEISTAVTKVGDAAEKKEKAKAAGFTFSVKATADATTTVTTKALYKGVLKLEDQEIADVKKVYTIDAGVTYYAEVLHGNELTSLKSVVVEKNKSEDTTAQIADGDKGVQFKVDAKEAGNTKLKLKVTTEDDAVVTYAVNVRPEIQSISVKSVSRGVLKQTIDTTKEYKVTFKPAKADVANIYAVAEADVAAVLENGILTVTTKPGVKNAAGTIHFYKRGIAGAEDQKIEGASVTVNAVAPVALESAKPTVKVIETTDTSIVLNLGTPKKVEIPVQGALYYEIIVIPDAVTTVPDSIINATKDPIYIESTGLSQVETIVVNNAGTSFGQAWKYNVEVRLVQLDVKKEAGKITQEDIVAAFGSKIAKAKAATQQPAYETKLSIKKGTTTIYTGQADIAIGTPTYSKKTTYRSIKMVEDITEGITEEQKLQVDYKDGQFVTSAPAGSNVAIGKHTIIAYADAPEGSKAASATVVVTVVRGIEDITVVPDGNFIFKQYNKAATLTVKPVYNTFVTAELPEPKTKKVTYAVVDKNKEEMKEDNPLYGMVTVKNGKITVNKNYVVSPVAEENMFCIKVTAVDYKEADVCAYSELIQIKSTTPDLGEAVLVTSEPNGNGEYDVVSRGNESIKVEQFNASRLVVVKSGIAKKNVYTSDELVDSTELSLTSSNKAINIDADGKVFTEQTAKNITLNAVTKDGSKKKVSLAKLTLEYTVPLALGVNISRGTYDYMGADPIFYTIGSPDSTTVSYKASNNEIFKLEVMQLDENDNWSTITPEECMNYTLTLKGAKQLSVNDNTYLITATAAETTITLTDKTNSDAKTVYTLINEAGTGTGLTSLKASTADILINGKYDAVQTITFEVAAGGDYSYEDKYAEIRIDTTSAQKNQAAYTSLMDATDGIDGYHSLYVETIEEYNEDGEVTASETTVTFSVDFKGEVDPGNYKLNVTLGTVESGDFIADTKTTSVTLKTIEHKKQNITFKPVTNYTISPADNKPVILDGTINDENASYRFTGIHNVISSDGVNEFDKYFKFTPHSTQNVKGGRARLELYSGMQALDLLTQEGKKNCSAFVDYEVYDKNGVLFKKDTVKITVSVQKEPTQTIVHSLLPVMQKANGEEMFTTLTLKSGGNGIYVPHMYITQGSFVGEPYGTSGIKLTTKTLPQGNREIVQLYWLPDTSCFQAQLEKYKDEGDRTSYNDLLQTYGIQWRGSIEFRAKDRLQKDWFKVNSIHVEKRYFVRAGGPAGIYEIPLTYTTKAAVDIEEVKVVDLYCSRPGDLGDAWKNVDFIDVDVSADDTLRMIVEKAPLVQRWDSLKNSREIPQKIQLEITYAGAAEPITVTPSFTFRRDARTTFAKIVEELDRLQYFSKAKVKWAGDASKTVDALEKWLEKTLYRYTREVDSDVFINYTIDTKTLVEPTRLVPGTIEGEVVVLDTITSAEKRYPLTAAIPALGAWPEDIAGELNDYLTAYQNTVNPKIYNHTIAEDIANDIREQEFIKKHTQFKVDVSNLTKVRATEERDGQCSVKVRILDTTGKGASYENTYTWPIYRLISLEEMKDLLTEQLALKEANNRTDKETVESWIEEIIYNKDIIWNWRDDYSKELSTHEREGCITGTLEMQNPKAVINPEAKVEVPISIKLQKMTDPQDIYTLLDGVVGENAIGGYDFFHDEYSDDGSEMERIWLTKQEMADMLLEKANTALKEADEMYYAEYDKDEDGNDKFEYSLPTYKTDRTISYTIIFKNEFTDETAGDPIVVEQYVLEQGNPEEQTLTDWKADILELLEEEEAKGSFTNDTEVYNITDLIMSVRKSAALDWEVNHSETDNGTEDDFEKQEATLDQDGWIKMGVTLFYNHYLEDEKHIVLELTLKIPALSQSMTEATEKVNEVLTGLETDNMISNATTADDILNVVTSVLKKSKYQVTWSEQYQITPATAENAGSITGKLLLTNVTPEEGEEKTVEIAVNYVLAKLKTFAEAETAVGEAVASQEAVLKLAAKGTFDEVKERVLQTAQEIIKYDGYTVSYKKNGSEDMFFYTASTHREPGNVSYTLVLSSDSTASQEKVEIVVKETELPVDKTKQTYAVLNTELTAKFNEMTNNGEISNDTTAYDLLAAAAEVCVNPNMTIYIWNAAEFGSDGTIFYVKNGNDMTKLEATATRDGKITIDFVIEIRNEVNGNVKSGYRLMSKDITIPWMTN